MVYFSAAPIEGVVEQEELNLLPRQKNLWVIKGGSGSFPRL